MTRPPWVALAITTVPVLAGAVLVSATLGPVGAIAYGALLLSGVNSYHLITRKDHHR